MSIADDLGGIPAVFLVTYTTWDHHSVMAAFSNVADAVQWQHEFYKYNPNWDLDIEAFELDPKSPTAPWRLAP